MGTGKVQLFCVSSHMYPQSSKETNVMEIIMAPIYPDLLKPDKEIKCVNQVRLMNFLCIHPIDMTSSHAIGCRVIIIDS